MQERLDAIERSCPETEVLDELLELDDKRILELGCGRAELTRAIAEGGSGRTVLALEVDEAQHRLNVEIDDLPNVTFDLAGAQAIPAPDSSVDVVLMFKSLHHVPVEDMDRALSEIERVLVPGGVAYISEPVFDGDFNEVLRIFHDESRVRAEAFAALQRAVARGALHLERELFFRAPVPFDSFEAFESRVMGVTHTSFALDDDIRERVRTRFADFADEQGSVCFAQPIRVDLLRRA